MNMKPFSDCFWFACGCHIVPKYSAIERFARCSRRFSVWRCRGTRGGMHAFRPVNEGDSSVRFLADCGVRATVCGIEETLQKLCAGETWPHAPIFPCHLKKNLCWAAAGSGAQHPGQVCEELCNRLCLLSSPHRARDALGVHVCGHLHRHELDAHSRVALRAGRRLGREQKKGHGLHKTDTCAGARRCPL